MKGRIAFALGPRRPLEVDEFTVHKPGPRDVLVRVLAAGICGSDVHTWRGELPYLTALPCAQGHEMVGEIVELGVERAKDSLGRTLREGDRIAYSYFNPCGVCAACTAGTVACPNRYALRAMLTVNDAPHFHGAFGDYYFIREGQWIFKLPADVAAEHAVPANCAVSQALAAVSAARIKIGDTVVVQGLGGLGIYACAFAKDSGAGLVIGVDLVPDRLQLARRFGADEVIDLSVLVTAEDRIAEVMERSGGGGADVVIEMAGVPSVISEGISYLRPAGRYILVGNVQAQASATIIPQSIVRASKEIIGVVNYEQWVLPRALGWLDSAAGRYPFDELVAQVYRLEDINDAIGDSDWAASRGNLGRAVISMSA
jgi:L-iditol 2-dehydrogenase